MYQVNCTPWLIQNISSYIIFSKVIITTRLTNNIDKNEVHVQPSSLLTCLQVSDYKTAFTSLHLVFLELGTHHFHLDFKPLDENHNVIIQRPLYLQQSSKDYEQIP